MVQKKTYTRRKKRYYKRRYKRYRKWKARRGFYRHVASTPELHKSSMNFLYGSQNETSSTYLTNGSIVNIGAQSKDASGNFFFNNVPVSGRKINLKYIYIKGYVCTSHQYSGSTPDSEPADYVNYYHRIALYNVKRNLKNTPPTYADLYDTNLIDSNPNNWEWDTAGVEHPIRDILFKLSYKEDVYKNIKIYQKKKFMKYKFGGDVIPFKMRLSINQIVEFDQNTGYNNPSTNAWYMAMIMPPLEKSSGVPGFRAHINVRLYWTDN